MFLLFLLVLFYRSFMQSWTAFTWPITTGSTAYKWEGLGRIVRRIFLPSTFFYDVIPRWYFTSPELPQLASSFPVFYWNYANIFWGDLLNTHFNAFNLPRCAIPKPKYYTPYCAAVCTNLSMNIILYFT